ncbi:MAG: hypothetical protein ACPLPT_09675 [Moorellales bacterium]
MSGIPKPVLEYFAAYGLDEAKVKELYAPSRPCGCGAAPPPAKPGAEMSTPAAPGREPPHRPETAPKEVTPLAGPAEEGSSEGFWAEETSPGEEEPKEEIGAE